MNTAPFTLLEERLHTDRLRSACGLPSDLTYHAEWQTCPVVNRGAGQPGEEAGVSAVNLYEHPVLPHQSTPTRAIPLLNVTTGAYSVNFQPQIAALLHVALTHWPAPNDPAAVSIQTRDQRGTLVNEARLSFQAGEAVLSWHSPGTPNPATGTGVLHTMRVKKDLHRNFLNVVERLHRLMTVDTDPVILSAEQHVRNLLNDRAGRRDHAVTHALTAVTLAGFDPPHRVDYRLSKGQHAFTESSYQDAKPPEYPREHSRVEVREYRHVLSYGVPALQIIPNDDTAPEWTVHPDLALLYEAWCPPGTPATTRSCAPGRHRTTCA